MATPVVKSVKTQPVHQDTVTAIKTEPPTALRLPSGTAKNIGRLLRNDI